MTFGDRSVLVGLVALAIPLAIHLLGRRRARRVPLPTVRFADGAHQATRGRLWLKRAALLGCRLAVIALLVLALAQPQTGGARESGPGGPWIICLDTSPSMLASGKGTTRYEQAREAVLRLLAHLDGTSPVTLVRSGRETVQGTPERIRAALPQKPTVWWHDEPLASLIARAAVNLPETARQGRPCLVLLTDATDWALRNLGPAQFKDLDAEVRLVPIGGETRNGRLGLPRFTVAETEEGRRLFLDVDVAGADASRSTTVHLALVGQSRPQSVAVGPGEARAKFTAPLEGTGPWQGRVWIVIDDALAADNERFFTAAEPAPIRVLIVDAAHAENEPVGAADLVAAAFPGLPPAAKKVTRAQSDAVDEAALGQTDVVLWIGPQAGPSFDAVERFVRGGGALIWLPANAEEPEEKLAELLGAEVDGVETAADGATINPGGYASDLLAAFEGGAAADLAGPVFTQRLVLKPRRGSASIHFTDGRTAVVSQTRGRGRTVALAVGPGKTWGNLAARPEFVVLMHSLVEALAPDRTYRAMNRVVGRPWRGQEGPARGPGNYPGALPADSGAQGRLGRSPYSVNLPPEETADLTPQPNRLAAAFSDQRTRVLDPSQAFDLKGLMAHPATNPAAWFVVALTLVLAAETFLAGRPRRPSP
ncbi:MAG TPA: BatA and WFA domain-containing protein [Phycisphaerae bacterium]|nr:BatA and WFA domain-containing protein [Phycisphaerae bacterium]